MTRPRRIDRRSLRFSVTFLDRFVVDTISSISNRNDHDRNVDEENSIRSKNRTESWRIGRCKRRCLTVAAANSFQAWKGATGVIGHNLVDILIYKQSLMKFLVFINNALQPRAALAPVSASVPGNPMPSPILLLLILRFPSHPSLSPLHRGALCHPLSLPTFRTNLSSLFPFYLAPRILRYTSISAILLLYFQTYYTHTFIYIYKLRIFRIEKRDGTIYIREKKGED